ncbi:TolC family outer membrane protein [Aestuariivirga sp.]|uniref:TolC family outer membrane protein n=1 Tax=Aestuariivirga sp. TaxID=2650926 RepID=UPI0039E30916
MKSSLVRRILGLAMAAAVMAPASAFADTVADAMAQAYLGNPTLRGARAGQRATDEQVPQALSGWRPTVTVQTEVEAVGGKTKSYITNNSAKIKEVPGSVSITLTQPIYNGGRTTASVAQAEANVKAGQQNLLATEQSVLYNAVSAYINVYADRQLVALQQENVRVLQAQLGASDERFKVGEITRTDVAQARASLSGAKGSLANQQAILAGDVAKYLQIIGKQPGKLTYPELRRMPPSVEIALAKAAQLNPNILAAAFVEDASLHQIDVQRSALLPQISLQGQAAYLNDFDHNSGSKQHTYSVAGVLSVPLYEGGSAYASIREAKQLASQQRIAVIEVARSVRQAVSASWSALAASREIIAAAKDQVSASQLALDGVRQEYQAGTRTTLDVLNAQADVVTAKTTLVNAQRSQILAGYQLLAAVGELTARDQHLNVPYYDPQENYNATRGKWIGTGVETVE